MCQTQYPATSFLRNRMGGPCSPLYLNIRKRKNSTKNVDTHTDESGEASVVVQTTGSSWDIILRDGEGAGESNTLKWKLYHWTGGSSSLLAPLLTQRAWNPLLIEVVVGVYNKSGWDIYTQQQQPPTSKVSAVRHTHPAHIYRAGE